MALTAANHRCPLSLLACFGRALALGLVWSAVLVGQQAACVAPILSAWLTSDENKASSPLEEDEALPGDGQHRGRVRSPSLAPFLDRAAGQDAASLRLSRASSSPVNPVPPPPAGPAAGLCLRC